MNARRSLSVGARWAALLLAFTLGGGEPEQVIRERLRDLRAKGQGESLAAADAVENLSEVLRVGSKPKEPEVRESAEQSVRIRERLLGPEHPRVADALVTLGGALSVAGDYAGALRAFERSLAIREKVLPEGNKVAQSLDDVGAVLIITGDYAPARRALERSLAIRRRIYGDNHPDVAQTLNDLGILLWRLKDFGAARPLLEQALAIRQRMLVPDDPLIAASLNNLAIVLNAMGDLQAARTLYERALVLREKALGPDHPRLANGLDNLATVLLKLKGYDSALVLMRRALAIRKKALGEMHREVAISWEHIGQALYLSGRRTEALEAALRAEEIGRQHLLENIRGLPEISALRYSAARVNGVELALTLVAGRPSASETRQILNCLIRSRGLAIDEMIARRRHSRPGSSDAGYLEIRRALPPDSALVSFIRYEHFYDANRSEHAYAAFVIRGGREPVAVWLGSAPKIDALVSKWRQEISMEASAPGMASGRYERSSREAGMALRRAVWDAPASQLAGVRRVFIVPDGALCLINFQALPAEGDRYLAESGPLMHYLDVERDLLRTRAARSGAGLLAVGNLDYGGKRFSPLPASTREVQDVVNVWKRCRPDSPVTLLRGMEGSEAALQQKARGRQVLHLATHGIFEGKSDDNPLLRSGLALSGGQLLTAEEASVMDLEGVDWVVLSGCNTGLGEVAEQEGLIGLRRAFQLAGAGTVITSLWPVEDKSAERWMGALYRAHFQKGAATAEAVRGAYLEVLASRRARKQSTHPFYWAAFVATGRAK
jgi:tetratricopeptide (TPR) repeat protein